jgi:hypothetical protein
MRKLFIAILFALVCLPAFAGEAKIKHNIIRAKWELWNKLDHYASVYGVGIGADKDSGNMTEILFVYADCSDAKTLQRIPVKFKGIKVSVACTGPIKAEDIK